MKLSEAAELGRTLTTVCPGTWFHCFVAAAGRAVGINREDYENVDSFVDAIYDYWPWLALNYGENLSEIIEYYDTHTMTYDRLVSYVKTLEPPCGECNTFDCCCTRAEVTFEEALKDPFVWV